MKGRLPTPLAISQTSESYSYVMCLKKTVARKDRSLPQCNYSNKIKYYKIAWLYQVRLVIIRKVISYN